MRTSGNMQKDPSHKSQKGKSGSQDRTQKTLDNLCEAACRILENGDRSELTTQKVAEVSGYGVGTVYQYFSNKEELLEALAMRELDRMLGVAGKILTDWNAAPSDAVMNSRRLIAAMIEIIGERPRLGGILRTEMINAPEDSALGQGLQRYYGLIVGMASRTHPEKSHRLQTDSARFVLFRAISSTIQTAAVERPSLLRSREFEDEMVRLILGFLSYTLPGEDGSAATAPV
ncbi:TetR family transcriptional regulator [Herbaspirillum sp. GCM10030257]|uniref:TetR family transcriptional regulator n=1 Tax=Herbaspirillum sp. GCM10030257 TaxID=3273393 RepID=UPI003608B4DA